ncbi:hypothetical protein ACSQ67_025123 [Phaseolus vulgaris]
MWSSKFLFVLLSCLVFHFPSDTTSLVRMPLCNHHDASALLSFKSLFTLTPPGPDRERRVTELMQIQDNTLRVVEESQNQYNRCEVLVP